MASSWTTWKEQRLTYLLQLRGVALIPLVYLYCNLDEPTDNMWAEAYPNEDARSIPCYHYPAWQALSTR
jgi:hypothetical protein